MHTAPAIGGKVDEIGTLIREASRCWLRRDAGGRWALDLHRVRGDPATQRVRVTGVFIGNDLVDVDQIEAP